MPDTTASVRNEEATGKYDLHVKVGPNPVTEHLQIRFELPSESKLRADLYDATGCRLRTVVSGSWTRGSHMVTADLSTVSPGIYFLRFRDERGASLTRPVVIYR